jgi:hypothetical protein
MKYDKLKLKVNQVKSKRQALLKSFTTEKLKLKEILLDNIDNNEVNSIRVHKFLTSSGELGKVNTARFLESIDLDENTKISDLNIKHIDLIINFIEQ